MEGRAISGLRGLRTGFALQASALSWGIGHLGRTLPYHACLWKTWVETLSRVTGAHWAAPSSLPLLCSPSATCILAHAQVHLGNLLPMKRTAALPVHEADVPGPHPRGVRAAVLCAGGRVGRGALQGARLVLRCTRGRCTHTCTFVLLQTPFL